MRGREGESWDKKLYPKAAAKRRQQPNGGGRIIKYETITHNATQTARPGEKESARERDSGENAFGRKDFPFSTHSARTIRR